MWQWGWGWQYCPGIQALSSQDWLQGSEDRVNMYTEVALQWTFGSERSHRSGISIIQLTHPNPGMWSQKVWMASLDMIQGTNIKRPLRHQTSGGWKKYGYETFYLELSNFYMFQICKIWKSARQKKWIYYRKLAPGTKRIKIEKCVLTSGFDKWPNDVSGCQRSPLCQDGSPPCRGNHVTSDCQHCRGQSTLPAPWWIPGTAAAWVPGRLVTEWGEERPRQQQQHPDQRSQWHEHYTHQPITWPDRRQHLYKKRNVRLYIDIDSNDPVNTIIMQVPSSYQCHIKDTISSQILRLLLVPHPEMLKIQNWVQERD